MNRARMNKTAMVSILISMVIAAALLVLSAVLLVPKVQAAPGGISGTITYYGSRSGTIGIQLAVFTTTAPSAPPPVRTAATSTDVGAYTIDNVEEGAYFIFTYLDLNSDFNYNPGEEPFAWYDYEGDGRPDAITVAPGSTTRGIDILLTDLWQPLGGPLGQVNAIAARPGVSGALYAVVGRPYGGKDSTIYRTTDGAATWTAVATETGRVLNTLDTVGALVYAGGEGAAGKMILQSLDSGDTWTDVLQGVAPEFGAIRDIAIDSVDPVIAYAVGVEQGPGTGGVRSGRVFRTQNNGADWQAVHTVPEGDLYAVAVNPVTPTIVFAGGYYRDNGAQFAVVYNSVDGGASWTPVLTDTYYTIQQFTDIVVHPVTPTLVFAGSQTEKAVYRSTDGGLSWTRVYTDRGFRLAIDPLNRIYAADDWRELAVSTDNGDTWDPRIGGELTPDIMQAMALDLASGAPGAPAPLYLGFRERGVYRSDDGGVTWTARNNGLVPTTAPLDIEIDPQNQNLLYVATGCDGGWRTGDHGQTWERLLGDCVATFAIHPQNSGVVYAGITGSASRAIMRSEAGVSFETAYAGNLDVYAIEIAHADTDVVLAGGEDAGTARLVASKDNGLSWSEVFSLPNGAVTALAIHPVDAGMALVGVTDRGDADDVAVIYRTADGGLTWTPVYTEGVGAIHSVVFDRQQLNVVYATDSRHVLKSVDGGETWLAPLLSYLGDSRNLLAMDPRLADHVYLAGPGYIAETIDGGQNWSDWQAPINQGTEGRTATALAVSQGGITQTLYAGFSGVWFYNRPSPQTSDFTTERVLANLAQPTAIDWAPDGRMFIAHQSGLVLVHDGGAPTVFIDLSDEVNNNWNRGLIGIAVHPEFPTQPYVYLLYTYDPPGLPGPDGAIDGRDGYGARVSRLLRVTAEGPTYHTADRSSGLILLGVNSTLATLGDPADGGGNAGIFPACTEPDGLPTVDCLPSEGPSHSVGAVAFGHDGNLWVTNGEGAPYIIPDTRAGRSQDLDSLGGKVLRIDPQTGLGVPGNPYYDPANPGSNRSRVWAMGLRNPFRFALHPVDNIVYVGDVGWYAWEELNYGSAGYNYGWPCYEGGASGNLRHTLYNTFAGTAAACLPLYAAEPNNGIEPPLYAYQNIAGAAIVAGDFYTGTRYPKQYQGVLFIADYDKRTITYLTFDEAGVATVHPFMEEVSALGGPVDLRLGPDGYLYFVALNPDPSGASEIRRIVHTSAPVVEIDAHPRYGLEAPLRVQFTTTLSVEDTGLLAYNWTFGDGGTSIEAQPVHTYTTNGVYTAILTVTTPQGKSSSDAIAIVVGDAPPVVTITQPQAGSVYTINTPLSFSGHAVYPRDGQPVPAANLRWRAQWNFNDHLHSPFYSLDGAASGSLLVPEHNDNTTMFLCLTAVDDIPELLDPTTCIELHPQTTRYTFLSSPNLGYTLSYEGIDYTTPFTIDVMVNARRSIGAPLEQDGLPFAFWSQGGAASQEIVGLATPQTFTATYGTYALPVAQIEATPQSGAFPLTVQFTSTLSVSAGAGIGPRTYQWAFGDGGSATLAQPTHTYSAEGSYTVTLTVTTPLGSVVSNPLVIDVTVPETWYVTYLPVVTRGVTP